MNRSKSTILTLINRIIGHGLSLILGFFSRTVFIYVLGEKYLGINGLFSNILSLLSLMEFGFGSAITYYMYKPAAENDTETIAMYLTLYKKIYRIIGMLMFGLGLLLLPFLSYIVNFETNVNVNLYYVYVLYLINTCLPFLLFTYRRVLYTAYLSEYRLEFISNIISVLLTIMNICSLLLFRKYYIYLYIAILGTFITNISIGMISSRDFSNIIQKPGKKCNDSQIQELKKNVYSIFVWNIGNTFMTSTDNIIISVICGTTIVGYYSNYFMFSSAATAAIGLMLGALSAGIGNYSVSKTKAEQVGLMEELHFFNFWILTYVCVCLMSLVNPIVNMWLGKTMGNKYVLGEAIPFFLGVNLWLTYIMGVVGNFRNALGLFWHARNFQLYMGVLNIFLSVALGKIYGLGGIVAATGISIFIFAFTPQPYVVFKYGFKMAPWHFIKGSFEYLMTFLGLFVLTYFSTSWIIDDTFLTLIIRFLLCTLIVNVGIYIIYRKTVGMNAIIRYINIFKSKLIKKKRG